MLIVALYYRSLLSGIHHTYQVKGTVGSGNASWIRVFGPEPYCTDPYRLVETRHKCPQISEIV